jgi:predicted O-methyltransferase YrrM
MNPLQHPRTAVARVPALRALLYAAEAVRFRLQQDDCLRAAQHVRDYADWRASQRPTSNPLTDHQPWLTFGAIRYLDARLQRGMHVFEYGSGGSTIFFAERAADVVAVEHEPDWHRKVAHEVLAASRSNVRLLLMQPSSACEATASPDDPDGYASIDRRFTGCSFRRYAAAIDAWPDDSFDVIIVDGRARPSCCKHAMPKLAPGGVIVLDNAERAHYAAAIRRLDAAGWTRREFAGAGPYNRYFWKTFAWERPAR